MLISKCDLPLVPEELAEVTNFCKVQVGTGIFRVLGQIPEVLRRDWLDEELDAEVRASQHTNVEPAEWRAALESMCSKAVEAYLREQGSHKRIVAVLMWRAALAYHRPLAICGIRQCHTDVKRDEGTLKVIERMPLNEPDQETLRTLGGEGQVLIPDPMLASGSSASYTIELVRSLGIQNSQITVGCVVAAPEGVFNLLNQFPGIRITAATMDGCLNSDAYIVNPGLGDAGEKYFCGNSPENFSRNMFTDAQWAHLGTYFDCQK